MCFMHLLNCQTLVTFNVTFQIERCRPYFLCMMGERYGWAQPENKPDDLLNQSFDYAIDNFPVQLGWLERYRFNTSVTQVRYISAEHSLMAESKLWVMDFKLERYDIS